MAKKIKTGKKKLIHKLRNKYRLVILNAETFEEKFSLKLSPMNVFVITGSASILLIFLTTYLIAFTPLREYIPGYPSSQMKNNLYKLVAKADSLEKTVNDKDVYINNIRSIIMGHDVAAIEEEPQPETPDVSHGNISFAKSKADSALRAEIESIDNFSVNFLPVENSGQKHYSRSTANVRDFFFFTPLKGLITNHFNPIIKHYGIDIVAKKNEAIKSTMDGTVIFSSWTLETGYVIAVQHQHNIISVYKHNSALLKGQGSYVKAGDPIAIIGESGELSSGPHLHFELWFNGSPVNPADYIVF